MITKTMRAAGVALVLALAATGCTAGQANGDATTAKPVSSPTSTTASSASGPAAAVALAGDRLSILRRPFAATDALPASGVDAPDGVVLNSQRRAGADDGTTFWIAATTAGGACLIAVNPDTRSPDTFSVCSGGPLERASAVTGMVGDDGHRIELATDGFAPTAASHWRRITANVWAQ